MLVREPDAVLIIGGGLCAAVVADRLAEAGVRFRLVCPPQGPSIERIPRQGPIGRSRHLGLALGWADGLGGTTNLWGGQLWPWEASDHGPGWPDWIGSLSPQYRSVANLLDPGGSRIHPTTLDGAPKTGQRWPELSSAFNLRTSSWLPMKRRSVQPLLQKLLRRHADAFVPGVARRLDTDGERTLVHVDQVGTSLAFEARAVVVAAGTLGTLDLLANSRADRKDWPALGTGVVDHTSFLVGSIRSQDPRALLALADRYEGGRRLTPKLIFRDAPSGRRAYAHFRPIRPTGGTPDIASWGQAARSSLTSLGSRRRPAPFGFELRVDVEQLVSDGHRFVIEGDERYLDWDVTEAERTLAGRVAQQVLRDVGDIVPGALTVETNPPDCGRDIFHLMGGASLGMGDTDAVVLPDLRLHGMPHVSIVGLSTFPEAGVANPSFLAAAIARRVADRLVDEMS